MFMQYIYRRYTDRAARDFSIYPMITPISKIEIRWSTRGVSPSGVIYKQCMLLSGAFANMLLANNALRTLCLGRNSSKAKHKVMRFYKSFAKFNQSIVFWRLNLFSNFIRKIKLSDSYTLGKGCVGLCFELRDVVGKLYKVDSKFQVLKLHDFELRFRMKSSVGGPADLISVKRLVGGGFTTARSAGSHQLNTDSK